MTSKTSFKLNDQRTVEEPRETKPSLCEQKIENGIEALGLQLIFYAW